VGLTSTTIPIDETTNIPYDEEPMSLCLRPVIEHWGESYYYSIEHDEVVNLLREIAALAAAGRTWQHDYGDLTVVAIEEGARFLDFLLKGREALFEAKQRGNDNYDLTDDEIEAVEEMANLVMAWRQSLDPDDGFLRIYVD
jgi:hypothetical protein